MPGIIGFAQFDPGYVEGGKPSDERTNQDSTRIITHEELEFGHDSNAYGLAIYDADQDASAQQPSPDMPPSNDSIFNPLLNKETAIEHNERARREREPARNKQSQSSDPVVPDVSSEDRIPQDIDMFEFLPTASGEEPSETGAGHENTPLTPGQAYVVDYLLTLETDCLAREVLIGLKRDGLPPKSQWKVFMAQFALCGWDETSDAQALNMLNIVASSDWNTLVPQADSSNDSVITDSVITFSLDDVRQFIGIDLATQTFDDADVAHYEKMLNNVFDYEIVFKVKYGYSPEQKIRQMQNLAKANVHIVDYFAFEAGLYFDVDEALEVFRKHFSRTDEGKLQVHLGDNDETKGATFGLVPLPESTTQKSVLDTVFLGSQVAIPTIVHEFGHVIDRNINMRGYLEGDLGDGKFHLSKAHPTYGAILDETILKWVIEGFVAKQFLARELWADLFMTAVLSGMGFKVKSIEDKHIGTFAKFKDDFFECNSATNPGDAPCIDRDVVWENHPIARAVREFLPTVFHHAMSARD